MPKEAPIRTPEEILALAAKVLPPEGEEGVIIQTHPWLPEWLGVALTHIYRPRPAVAIYEDWHKARVVWANPASPHRVGEIIDLITVGPRHVWIWAR